VPGRRGAGASIGHVLRPTLPDDPFLRWHLSPDAVHAVWARGGATGVLADRRRGRSLVVVGDPGDAADLVAEVLEEAAPQVTTLVRGTLDVLRERAPGVAARLVGGDDWDFFWTDAAPAQPVPGEEDAVRLAVGGASGCGADDAAVGALLAVASDRPSARPGDAHAGRWWGVRGTCGLLACVAATTEDGGPAPHLAALATHPRHRGRGLGGAVTAAATRDLLGTHPVVTLGMYADNVPARRVYERLGWHCSHRFSSRLVRGARRAPVPGSPRPA